MTSSLCFLELRTGNLQAQEWWICTVLREALSNVEQAKETFEHGTKIVEMKSWHSHVWFQAYYVVKKICRNGGNVCCHKWFLVY